MKKTKKKSKLRRALDMLEVDDPLVLLEGPEYDDAITGIEINCSGTAKSVIYDKTKILDILMKQGIKTIGEAEEYFDFNIIGSHLGPTTPTYMITKNDLIK